MNPKKILIISLDFEKNKKIESFIQKNKTEPIEAIALIDENIINTVSEIFTEKGWLGAGQAENIKELFLKKAERKAEEWLAYIKKIAEEQKIKIPTKTETNTIENYIQNQNQNEIKKVVFTFKKGMNTTYETIKDTLEKIQKQISDTSIIN